MLGGCVRCRCATASSPLSFATSADPIRTDRAAGRSPPNKPPSRRLGRAFDAFFRGVQAGRTPGFPRFKGAGWFDTVEWPSDRDGCRWDSTAGEHRLYLQSVGHIRVHQHREVRGRVKTISVKRDNQRWYVLLSCDDVPPEPLERTGSVVGIDLGVKSFLTTSDGVHVPNPRHLERSASRLAAAQRTLARCRRGSTRRQRARAQVAGLHGKVRRQRLDHAHKVALDLVRRHDVICHEALRIGNMSRSARGTMAKPGRNVPSKAGLNRSILDAGWGVFLRILASKAESADRELIAVDPRDTSITCPTVGTRWRRTASPRPSSSASGAPTRRTPT